VSSSVEEDGDDTQVGRLAPVNERILVVTPYPPIRDGIGTYAAQEVKRLLLEGNDVEVLSPQPSAAHHHLALRSPRGVAALAKRVNAYDRVVVQYHPDVFYPNPVGPAARAAITAGLVGVCLRAGNVELRVHEFKPEWGFGNDPLAALQRAFWSAARRVEVHTDTEKRQLCEAYRIDPSRVDVVAHGAHFEAHAAGADRDAVRAELGIAAGEHCFLAIGFLQPHKGFDRAIRAFGRLGLEPGTARLDVVGGLRVEDDDFVAHVEDLRDLAHATPGATVHAGFVSDRRFDEWILAADTLVLPYRTIWSSGVIERARLYGTPVIASRVGGLEAQAGELGVTFIDTDDDLAEAMADALGRPPEPGASATWQPIVGAGERPDRDLVQAELRARAGVRAEVAKPAPGTARRGEAARQHRLAMPRPESATPLGRMAKRVVQRLTYWQVAPIVHHVNELHRAVDRDHEPDPTAPWMAPPRRADVPAARGVASASEQPQSAEAQDAPERTNKSDRMS
jgi:glycosyltransferase involved in cell wall biosynthesis